MKRLLLLLLLAASTAAAQVPAPPVPGDPRVQTLPYDAGRVVPLKVAMGYQLTLLFNADERVENVAIGDNDSWQATLNGRGDALFIKPLRTTGATNMTVITDARVYSFELSPAYGASPDAPFTIQFRYPAPAPPLTAVESGRYRLSGSRAVRPAAIADDGVRTTIDWRPGQSLPAVFAIGDGGEEVLVDGHTRDGRYVIDTIHRTLVFKLDGQVARANRRPTVSRQ